MTNPTAQELDAAIADRSDAYIGGYLRAMASDYNLRDDQREVIADAARRILR